MEVETHSLSPTFELIHLLSQSTTDTYFPPNNAANQPSLGHATAVLKLQKVYRTRLAGWPTPPLLPRRWQAIDYVRVNHSTISFFNLPETAASCWSRVKLNAAKVGKGLSKDAIAQKCWLSSIGSKLLIHDIAMDITYNTTIKNGVKQMLASRFFLLQEREQYEYIVREDKIINKQYGDLFHTNEDSEDAKWIFVMSTSKKLYAGKKKKGLFHHSSFLAGGATLAAGRLVAENEILKWIVNVTSPIYVNCKCLIINGTMTLIFPSISAYSGHYRPTDDTLDSFLSYLKENGVKLDEVELHKANEDSDIYEESNVIEKQQPLKCQALSPRAVVPKTAILQRINSKKASKSYQLGHQLSLKWSTGAGPRIGCVADYPIELRTQAYPFFIHANGRPCIAFSLSIL
ncbi:IQ domain-containing protein IQM3 [Glycine max]|nr:IQ domain-containing protein IQM3 [Glycine max]